MPGGFRIADSRGDLILPNQIDRTRLTLPPFCCQGIARLKPGVTLAQANADVARMLPIWVASWPYRGDGKANYLDGWKITPALRSLKQDVIGDVGNVLWVVMGTIGIVLLIACANVINLLLVRADGRQRELAVRAALGAGSGRIARTLLIESTLLGLIGGVLGLAFAYAMLKLLIAMAPAGLPRLVEIGIDARALGVTFLVSLLAGLLLGLIPALRFSSPRIRAALYSGGRSASQGREQHRTQNILVVAQVALALVLLVSSGLMIRTFQALHAVAPGFTDGATLQTLRIAIPESLERDAERVARMQNDIVDALAALPGVSSAAFGSAMPLEGALSMWDSIDVEGQPRQPGDTGVMRTFKFVSPGFFHTAGTQLIAGRDFTWSDIYDGRHVVLLPENLARELWREPAAAVGKRIRWPANAPWSEVIGVVQDVRENGVSEPAPAIVYWPAMNANFFAPNVPWVTRGVTVIIRSPLAGTATLLRQIEQAVWSVHPDLPVASPRTMADIYDRSLVHTTFTLAMLAIAGGVALTLGVIGLYGVLSYIVAQRRRDIAIRLALGARQRDIARSFVQYGVTLAIAGVALGLGAAAAVTRLMASLLHGVQPLDAITYATVAVLLTVVAALASYLPARRASSVDPAEALAAE
jgi:predicted permease